MNDSKRGILVVSFGTTYEEARKATIEHIEADIAATFPDHRFYRAWTSKKILAILKKRDGLIIPNVREAMEQIVRDGVTELVVQPTHILNGIENHLMKEDVLAYREHLESVSFGQPLLSNAADAETVMDAIAARFHDISPDSALVLMGHGTTHRVNSLYSELNQFLKDTGHNRMFLGTVEAEPTVEDLIGEIAEFNRSAISDKRAGAGSAAEAISTADETSGPADEGCFSATTKRSGNFSAGEHSCFSDKVSNSKIRKVVLLPFMIVAGDHAHNDMAGDEPDSWASRFRAAGYQVEPIIKGLGSYQRIRELFIEHVQTAMRELHTQ